MKLVIKFCGIHSLLFALFHIGFWKIFKWNENLMNLDYVNSGVIQILNVQIIFYFFFVAFVCIAFSNELKDTKLGKTILLGGSLFWLIRTVQQFIFFKVSLASSILIIFFIIGTILFALPILKKTEQ